MLWLTGSRLEGSVVVAYGISCSTACGIFPDQEWNLSQWNLSFGLLLWLSKESPHNVGDLGFIPGLGRCPGEGNGNPLQFLAWEISWTEEPGGLQFMGLQRVRHGWATNTITTKQIIVLFWISVEFAFWITSLRKQELCDRKPGIATHSLCP